MKKLSLVINRFPFSVAALASLAVLMFKDFSITLKPSPQLYVFFSLGTVISLVAALWLEDNVAHLKQHIITAGIMFLWGVYCFFLPSDEFSTNKTIELYAIALAAFSSIFFISFLGKGKEQAYWNFFIQTIFQLGIAYFFGIIIFGMFFTVIFLIESLFNANVTSNTMFFSGLYIACFVLFAPLYFLANIPDKLAKHSEEKITLNNKILTYVLSLLAAVFAKHFKKISLNDYLDILTFIFTGITAIYTIVLYVYLFKIVSAQELPKGSVSYLVSALAFSGLLIITLLYPYRFMALTIHRLKISNFVAFLSRYFGLIILPLLALMSVGIFHRINDYGFTINRYCVLLLNIWFYGVYIYIFITKAEQIKFIPISFAAIALLASACPG